MKPLIIFISLALAFYSCRTSTVKKENVLAVKNTLKPFKCPIVIDTFKNGTISEARYKPEETSYDLYYVGRWKDTIQLEYPPKVDKETFRLKSRMIYRPLPFYTFFKYPPPGEEKYVALIVDTNQVVNFPDGPVTMLPSMKEKYLSSKGYPVFVINQSLDTENIAAGMVFGKEIRYAILPIVLEAKDYSGKWRAVEHKFIFMCGNGLSNISIAPAEIAITEMPIYKKGMYKTSLRLKIFGEACSNEFYGYINQSQFTDEP